MDEDLDVYVDHDHGRPVGLYMNGVLIPHVTDLDVTSGPMDGTILRITCRPTSITLGKPPASPTDVDQASGRVNVLGAAMRKYRRTQEEPEDTDASG